MIIWNRYQPLGLVEPLLEESTNHQAKVHTLAASNLTTYYIRYKTVSYNIDIIGYLHTHINNLSSLTN